MTSPENLMTGMKISIIHLFQTVEEPPTPAVEPADMGHVNSGEGMRRCRSSRSRSVALDRIAGTLARAD